MGSLAAADFADQVEQGNIQLRNAVSWHLQSNHYPPHPSFMVEPAVDAILLGQLEDWDAEVDLPKGCLTHKGIIPKGAEGCVFGESDEDVKDFGACEIESVVQWQNRTDGKVRVGDIIESFHLDSFL